MATEQPAQDAYSVTELYKSFMLIAGVLGLVLYMHILRNRRYWVIMEAAIGVCDVIAFPICTYLLPKVWGIEDDSHHSVTFLLRLLLLGMISQAFVIYMTQDSNDPTVGLSVSVSNILTRGMLLCCVVNELGGKSFSKCETVMKVDAVFLCLLLVGDIFHMSKVTTNEGSRTVGDPISFHLSIDALSSFFLGALIFGFPNMFLHILTGSNAPTAARLFFSKAFGVTLLGGSILSFASLCFKNEKDAVTTLKSKAIIYLPILLLSLTNTLVDPFFRTLGHFLLMVVVFACLSYNAGIAAWDYEKMKRD